MTRAHALIDTHAHLDDAQFDEDRDAVIARARDAGVGVIINIGYRPGIWETTINLTGRYPWIRHTLGLHPHNADLWSPGLESDLRTKIRESAPVAIGEIGVDLYRNRAPLDAQLVAFRGQIALALEFGLPIVIHQRSAEAAMLDVLADAPGELCCVLHSFEASQAMADLAIKRGWALGVGGLMTRARAESVRAVLRQMPLDSILLETDAPYLAPAGMKPRNEPANLPCIADALAHLLDVDVAMVETATTANAERIFGRLAAAPVGSE